MYNYLLNECIQDAKAQLEKKAEENRLLNGRVDDVDRFLQILYCFSDTYDCECISIIIIDRWTGEILYIYIYI